VSELGLSEILMPVIMMAEVIMPEFGLIKVVVPVMIDAPVTPVLHLVEPGPLRAIQAAVGLHPGRGGVNAPLLIFQAAKFPGSHLSRLHALIDATFLSHFPLAEVGAVGFRLRGEAPQDDSARQQAGHDAFRPNFHSVILRFAQEIQR